MYNLDLSEMEDLVFVVTDIQQRGHLEALLAACVVSHFEEADNLREEQRNLRDWKVLRKKLFGAKCDRAGLFDSREACLGVNWSREKLTELWDFFVRVTDPFLISDAMFSLYAKLTTVPMKKPLYFEEREAIEVFDTLCLNDLGLCYEDDADAQSLHCLEIALWSVWERYNVDEEDLDDLPAEEISREVADQEAETLSAQDALMARYGPKAMCREKEAERRRAEYQKQALRRRADYERKKVKPDAEA